MARLDLAETPPAQHSCFWAQHARPAVQPPAPSTRQSWGRRFWLPRWRTQPMPVTLQARRVGFLPICPLQQHSLRNCQLLNHSELNHLEQVVSKNRDSLPIHESVRSTNRDGYPIGSMGELTSCRSIAKGKAALSKNAAPPSNRLRHPEVLSRKWRAPRARAQRTCTIHTIPTGRPTVASFFPA